MHLCTCIIMCILYSKLCYLSKSVRLYIFFLYNNFASNQKETYNSFWANSRHVNVHVVQLTCSDSLSLSPPSPLSFPPSHPPPSLFVSSHRVVRHSSILKVRECAHFTARATHAQLPSVATNDQQENRWAQHCHLFVHVLCDRTYYYYCFSQLGTFILIFLYVTVYS